MLAGHDWRRYHSLMTKVERLQQAIESLSPEERASFRAWYAEFDTAEWDQQFEADVTAGRLDRLADAALADHGKPVKRSRARDEIREQYDFSNGVRGKYSAPSARVRIGDIAVTEERAMSFKMTAVFRAVPEGGYVACVEELPGANTQGETLAEARANLREAVALVLEANRARSRL